MSSRDLAVPAATPLLLFRGLLGFVDALADTGFVTLAAGALLRLGMLLTHRKKSLIFECV